MSTVSGNTESYMEGVNLCEEGTKISGSVRQALNAEDRATVRESKELQDKFHSRNAANVEDIIRRITSQLYYSVRAVEVEFQMVSPKEIA